MKSSPTAISFLIAFPQMMTDDGSQELPEPVVPADSSMTDLSSKELELIKKYSLSSTRSYSQASRKPITNDET